MSFHHRVYCRIITRKLIESYETKTSARGLIQYWSDLTRGHLEEAIYDVDERQKVVLIQIFNTQFLMLPSAILKKWE